MPSGRHCRAWETFVQMVSPYLVFPTLSIHPMSDDQIRRYVATKSPLDKAGSYGVQDVEYIESTIVSGEKENIMGLPIKEIGEDFRRLGLLP